MSYRNIIGREVAKIRYRRGLSQSGLARELQLEGWDISRSEVSKIEMRIREVKDWQMMFLVRVLNAPYEAFYPKFDPDERLYDVLSRVIEF